MKKIILTIVIFVFSISIASAQDFFKKLDDWSKKAEKIVRTVEKTADQIDRVADFVIPRSVFVTNMNQSQYLYLVPTVSGGNITSIWIDGREIVWNGGNICLNPFQVLEVRFSVIKDPTSLVISYGFYTVIGGDVDPEKAGSKKINFSRRGDLSRNIDLR